MYVYLCINVSMYLCIYVSMYQIEQIHLFVEVLDRYFGNVCELDIIFNFHKAYYILDEIFIGKHFYVIVYFLVNRSDYVNV